jgi:hypothetical protein
VKRTARSNSVSRGPRLAAVIAIAAVTTLAPSAAAAAPGRSTPPDVVPLVSCVVTGSDGSWTAVFGYDNQTGATVKIPVGPANQVSPASVGEPQPTTFLAGIHHGVFSVTVSKGGGPMWHLGSDNLAARKNDNTCTSVQLPAEGNGTGMVMVVAAAGVVAAYSLRRRRLRNR